ncbi:hypothetical protein RD110_24295 [Rhodoferax koreense]|uniref:Type II secretion system protein GspB C-terminal domain-containing protein n=1 Tax=Rhodoferax koreensis TaxID=1842727 RepID=A0A1P8K1S1_9BURK|nr:general secretion pathway protein GspB [Rhodoferax koreense]APW39939.1 hypothetical protein RD110_24295 [Rhodoferax koreense]
MSYILEALKRADAERDRGAVPTLHSHAMPAAAQTRPRAPIANWIAAGALLALLVVAALWWTLGRQPAPVVLAPVVTPSPAPAVVAAAPALPAAPAAPVAVAPPRPAPSAPPRKAAEPPRAAAARPAASAAATAAPPQAAAPAPAPRTSAAPTAASLIYNVAELPDDIRAQLPKLSISGVTYSAQAAYRMLIVNGQVLHEGDEPAPGLTLETIRQKDMVLRFKGYRYSVGY